MSTLQHRPQLSHTPPLTPLSPLLARLVPCAGQFMAGEPGVLPDFECAWRRAAMQHARKLQPALPTSRQNILFDALELAASGDDHEGRKMPQCFLFLRALPTPSAAARTAQPTFPAQVLHLALLCRLRRCGDSFIVAVAVAAAVAVVVVVVMGAVCPRASPLFPRLSRRASPRLTVRPRSRRCVLGPA